MISYLAKMVFFRLMSWRIEGDFPQLKKFIVAVYPHTRNMDFIVGSFDPRCPERKNKLCGETRIV
jgi:hypothetical protein